MRYGVEFVHVSMKHDECWGEITDSNDLTIKTLFFEPYAKHSLMLGFISVKGITSNDLLEFIDHFKMHKTIHKVISTKRFGNTCNIAFFESNEDMTASVMSNYPLLWYTNSIYRGIENWRIMLPKNISGELKQDLTNVAKIIKWSSDYLTKDILSLKSQLTDVEYHTLRKAERLGYYESPRRIDLNELANVIGVSKQAASVTLRRAVKKLVFNSIME